MVKPRWVPIRFEALPRTIVDCIRAGYLRVWPRDRGFTFAQDSVTGRSYCMRRRDDQWFCG